MFCNKCGLPLPEGSNVCPNCGAAVTPAQEEYVIPNAQPEVGATVVLTPEMNQAWQQPAAPQEPAAPVYQQPVQQPVYQQPVYQQPVAPQPVQQPVFAQANFSEPPKKKKKKSFLPVAIIAGILAVIAVVAAIFWPTVSGALVKTFGSPEDYFRLVEKQAFKQYAQDLGASYGRYMSNVSASGSSAKLELNVSDTLLEMAQLEQMAGMEMDWLDDLAIEMEAGMDGQKLMLKAALTVAQQKILDGEAYMDMGEESALYLAIPMLSDAYLGGPLGMDMSANSSMLLYSKDFWAAMPTEEEMTALLEKYIEIAINEMDDVEKSSDTLEIGDVEQKVTVLEHKMTEKELLKIAEAVLKEAKSDKEIKKIIEAMVDCLQDAGMIPESADDIYQSYQEALEEAIDSLKEQDTDSDNYLIWTVYVDGKSEVVGRSIEVNDQEILFCATATKGKEFATELKLPTMTFSGDGTLEGDVRKGDYVLTVEGQDLLNVELEIDEKKTTDGNIEMSVELRPTEALLNTMGMNNQILTVMQSMDLGLGVKISSQEASGTIEVNVVGNSGVLAGLALSSEVKEIKVQMPDSSNVIDPNNVDEWLAEMDIQKVLDAMKSAGIPDELLETLVTAIMQQMYY